MIKKARITASYQVNLYCDQCGKRMQRGTSVLMTYPPTYCYSCECGYTATSNVLYPYQCVEFDEGNAEVISEESN